MKSLVSDPYWNESSSEKHSRTDDIIDSFIDRLESRQLRVGIIGLGYIGLPLSDAFIQKGVNVLGFDNSPQKLDQLRKRQAPMRSFSAEKVVALHEDGLFEATGDLDRLAEQDALIICLPTPLSDTREPDLSYITDISTAIAKCLRRGQLVVLESTTFPGTCEDIIKPILEQGSGLEEGVDFAIAYSPEREDPGNKNYSTGSIPKVVGADSEAGLKMATALYEAAIDTVVPVSNARTAEAVKLVENIFRLVNISLVNELKGILDSMDVDVWEVINAAKTKPFGYMPFYPGPGAGGHCIPVDPFYLSWKARECGSRTRFIDLAGEINEAMIWRVVRSASQALTQHEQKNLSDAKVLLMGVAYKPNIDDLRESPAMKIWALLEQRGASVDYHDPYVPVIEEAHLSECIQGRRSVPYSAETLANYDLCIVITDHACIDYGLLADTQTIIVDTRNALAAFGSNVKAKIHKA